MKKLLPLLAIAAGLVIILTLVGAAAFFFLWERGSGGPPSVTKTLPSATTVGLAGAQDLDQLAKNLLVRVEKLPAAQRKAMGPAAALADTAARTKMLGFDPATSDGWATLGVDPSAGFSVAVDARLMQRGSPVPALFFKLTDEAKLLAFVARKGGKKPTVHARSGPLKLLKMGDKPLLYFGTRQGWTVVFLQRADKVEGLEAAFGTYLTETSGDLGADPTFKQSFTGADEQQLFGYLSGQALLATVEAVAKTGALPKTFSEDGQFYVDLFPGAAAWADEGTGGGRLLASEQGATLIRKLFAPAHGPAKFSEFVPAKGYSAMRISLNLNDLFANIGEVLPPSMAVMKGKIAAAPFAIALTGVSWPDFAAAFTGHMVVAGDLAAALAARKDPSQAKVVLLMGVGDAKKADAVVPTWLGLASKRGGRRGKSGPKPEAVEIAGFKGHKLKLGPLSFAVVRVDDVLIVGTEAAVQASLSAKKGSHLSHKEGVDCLDGERVVEGVYYDAGSFAKAIADSGEPDAALLSEALKGQPIAGAVRYDKHGLTWRSEGAGFTAMVGTLAAAAIPAFSRYTARAKRAQGRLRALQKKSDAEMKKLRAAP